MHLDYIVSSGTFLTMNSEFDQVHGLRPGLEVDNSLLFRRGVSMCGIGEMVVAAKCRHITGRNIFISMKA